MRATDAAERACPTCGKRHGRLFAKERINPDLVGSFTYASRKTPEFMRHRLVRCLYCDTVYAPSPPPERVLSRAYASADYDSWEEAECAAADYARVIAPLLKGLPALGGAVEIGAGNGAFLPHLRRAGFQAVLGVEPSRKAIEAASAQARPLLREGVFTPETLAENRPALICSFMTLEHLPDPRGFVQAAHDALVPGGLLALVTHDWKAALNRLLGLRSPIIDIEHLQLFTARALQRLLRDRGFEDIQTAAFSNRYPLRYWLRLSPLPAGVRRALTGPLGRLGLLTLPLSLPVGNVMATGRKK
ncbi:Methyltransferase type 12 [Desulfarculus baarsii DSM 2075]|uniref:Methyltransferase type 12 n=1 Tax=Desulfarculus baarsii (strain ATCC 33931 / DSM 2075 / LMG 7858 / VKM B-1802 / 2st14) TaxID=644282 RepID=E1QIY4_DESB2|nr:class I SAM-dependent methyltransferase [Desulfarculus baarsii]ADK85527.1 Methyltransferase type 12 [Desulfarculus baarsii DSM 2075]